VCAIRFSGVQNPLPASLIAIIEKTAITMPPAIPPAIPARRTLALIWPSRPLLAQRPTSEQPWNGEELSGK